MGAREVLPGILLRRLQGKAHSLTVHVDVEHLDRDLLTNLDNLGGVVDVLPGQLGDVNEAVDPAQVNERTKVDDRGDDAGADLPLLEVIEEGLADLALGLLQPGTTRKHDVVAILVEFDDFGLESLADVGLQVTYAPHLHQRGREKAAKPDVENESALDDLNDTTLDDPVLFLDPLDSPPCALVLSALLGQDQPTVLVFLLQHERLNSVADGHHLMGVNVMLDGQFAGGDNTLGLVANVQKHLVPINLDNGALDDVAVIEVFNG